MTSVSNISDSAAAPAPVPVVAEAAPAASSGRVTVLTPKTASVIDSLGRTLKVKRLSALDRLRLFTACGAENSDNRQYMSYAGAAAAVTEVDGIPVPFPATELQVSALVARLDEEGLAAVIGALIALVPTQDDIAASAKNS